MRRVATAVLLLTLTACAPGGCSGSGEETPPAPLPDPAPAPQPEKDEPTPPAPAPVSWPHEPAGAIPAGQGKGSPDATIWAPGMRFPLEAAPAYANSQFFNYGGASPPGPGGGQCDPRNYAYPWRDNFCEARDRATPMCPTGKGHQGQDIRPATCAKKVHWVVAAEAGQVISISTWTVKILGDSGRHYLYLHMDMPEVRTLVHEGDRVARGQRIGRVSDDFGGTPTSYHLHFELKAPVTWNGTTALTWVPTYPSLVDSYGRLLNAPPPTT